MMNANGLIRLYDRLTVWERIPLLLAAQARGDDAEYRRLFSASAVRTWHFSEHLPTEQALHVLAPQYVGEQLDAAANYFFALWRMEDADDPQPEDWRLVADACAYFFVANTEAWRRICSELSITPETLIAGNYRGWFLGYCEQHMPVNAPTAEALQARLRESGRAVPQLVTADHLLGSWRNLLQKMPCYTQQAAGKGNHEREHCHQAVR
jgi:hypothetical protein